MLKSVRLTDIGDRELGDRKVEYPDEANIMTFPFIDWIRFLKYNIKDVLIQFGIERNTMDVMTYYMKSHVNLTPYNKIFRETHLLRNVREMYFNKDGWVQGNNLNIIDNDEDELWGQTVLDYEEDESGDATFKCAIMANPMMNDDVGIPLFGMKSNKIHSNGMDYDMGAFYPSIKEASNMDPATMLYNAQFNNDEFISGEYTNRSLNNTYQEKDKFGKMRNINITGEAINTYVSNNNLTFAFNYLNALSITEMYRHVMKQLKPNK